MMRVETLGTWVACAAVSVSAAASVANESDAQVQATINASPECAVSNLISSHLPRHSLIVLQQGCLIAALHSDCNLQDEKSCICHSQDFHADLIYCMRQHCRAPAIFGMLPLYVSSFDHLHPGSRPLTSRQLLCAKSMLYASARYATVETMPGHTFLSILCLFFVLLFAFIPKRFLSSSFHPRIGCL